MYNIDSMYEAMVEGLLQAHADRREARWMAAAAWWLGRQQIFSASAYWQAFAAEMTSRLAAAERDDIMGQLSKSELDLVQAAISSSSGEWPQVPDLVSRYVAAWAPVEPDLETTKADALRRIDASAEVYRLQFLTAGSGQAMAYQQKLVEARAKIANPSIADVEIPHIVAEAAATGMSKADKAAQIVATFEAWQVLSAGVEGKRAAAKIAVEAATTAADVAAAAAVDWASE